VVLAATDEWVDWDWISTHGDEIWAATRQHIELTALAVLIGFVIALPLALVAVRWRRAYGPILSVTGILYTIPSLALFVMLVPWTGLSRTSAEIGLVSYTLLILVRNIVTGLDAVPPEIRESATGMGYTTLGRLTHVELPLAVPAIMAGIRIATVTTVGLVTVTALIGQGGLGRLILDGLRLGFRDRVVLGAVLSVGLAVVADLLLAGATRLATPWDRRESTAS
jgi:osmoprotectant transport system permease protein